MEEPTNEYDGPNPLERLAEQVKIHIEAFEIPIALSLLLKPEVATFARYGKTRFVRETSNQPEARRDRITVAISEHPKWSDGKIADKLHVSRASVQRVRQQIQANIGAR